MNVETLVNGLEAQSVRPTMAICNCYDGVGVAVKLSSHAGLPKGKGYEEEKEEYKD